jgi:hypothetical protein
MIDLESLPLRKLQQEAARALTVMEAANNDIYKFNVQAHHNSQNWYKAVIKYYFEKHGGMPSEVGPAKDVKLVMPECTDTTK